MMNPASSEHRKPTAAAMSSLVPMCPIGIRFASSSGESKVPSACWRTIGVSMLDGGMLLTVMPFRAYSCANDLVSVITAPLDTA